MTIGGQFRGLGVRGIALGGICAAAIVSRGLAQEPFPGLDAYVSKAMTDWKIPGLALAIVRNDSVQYTKGYGVQKLGTNTPVDDRTLFEIGNFERVLGEIWAAPKAG